MFFFFFFFFCLTRSDFFSRNDFYFLINLDDFFLSLFCFNWVLFFNKDIWVNLYKLTFFILSLFFSQPNKKVVRISFHFPCVCIYFSKKQTKQKYKKLKFFLSSHSFTIPPFLSLHFFTPPYQWSKPTRKVHSLLFPIPISNKYNLLYLIIFK